MAKDDQFEQGLQMRQQVMGEAFVAKAFANVDAFTAPLQEKFRKFCCMPQSIVACLWRLMPSVQPMRC
jgi:hypothetical protein